MAKKKEPAQKQAEEPKEEVKEETKDTKDTAQEAVQPPAAAEQELARQKDDYLRLAAEYDNFRKRSQREKDSIYQDAKADTAKKFLPVYDNLERALKTETADEAFRKGVEMTLTELKKIMEGLGIQVFGEVGETFDPEKHNAVMHTEDEALGENCIAEVFQTGFTMGEKVIRFAMVKVAN